MNKPNVLLICVDHWPGRLLGCDGHPCVLTPTLDQLARNGIRFTNAYSATPVCVPARKALLSGTTSKTHGDRTFNELKPMPRPSIAETFAGAGYQCFAVGKMHVYPQRNRVGFHDIILHEEGRHYRAENGDMGADDYEMWLAERGYGGREFTHGMGSNNYMMRPWHLPEECHWTNWAVREMCRTIKRRDPTRPAFWFLSFNHPHPPLVPLQSYLDMYAHEEIPPPFVGEWAGDFDRLPYALKCRRDGYPPLSERELILARRAFYALCTHIDHQIRLVVGTLRETGILGETILAFTSDHGDMLGNHGLYAKQLMYEDSAKVPMILVPAANDKRTGHHREDDRLVELRDVMPTLLEMAGVTIPKEVEGMSMVSRRRRSHLYGELGEQARATRMIRDRRYKLIWYPAGNRVQLFDLHEDPDELRDLSVEASLARVRAQLTAKLIENLWGADSKWVRRGKLAGEPDKLYEPQPVRSLFNQRGWRFMGG